MMFSARSFGCLAALMMGVLMATPYAHAQQRNPDQMMGQTVLDLQRATRFVPTKADNYKGIEAAARSAELL